MNHAPRRERRSLRHAFSTLVSRVVRLPKAQYVLKLLGRAVLFIPARHAAEPIAAPEAGNAVLQQVPTRPCSVSTLDLPVETAAPAAPPAATPSPRAFGRMKRNYPAPRRRRPRRRRRG
jgi:hypothetical protein